MDIPGEGQAVPPIEPNLETPAAIPVVDSQPAVVEPDWKKIAEEEKAHAKRLKEQLAGKDKLIETYKTRNLVESFTQPEETQEYAEPQPQVSQQRQLAEHIAIEDRIELNRMKAERKYAQDEDVPWNEEVAQACDKILEELDPSGRGRLRADAYDKAYDMLKGRMLKDIKTIAVSKKEQEYAQKTKAKADAVVVSVPTAKPIEDKPTRPAVKDCKTTKELLLHYPEELQNLPKEIKDKILRGK
jgi:hypothetical protein